MYNHPEYMTDYARLAEKWGRKRKLKKLALNIFIFVVILAGVSIW